MEGVLLAEPTLALASLHYLARRALADGLRSTNFTVQHCDCRFSDEAFRRKDCMGSTALSMIFYKVEQGEQNLGKTSKETTSPKRYEGCAAAYWGVGLRLHRSGMIGEAFFEGCFCSGRRWACARRDIRYGFEAF